MPAYVLLLLILPNVMMFNSCAVVEQYQKNIQESRVSYPHLKDLHCEKGKGLLLVDAITSRPGNTLSLNGAAIINIAAPEKIILSGSFNTAGFLSPLSGVVVFPRLDAATYRVLKINMWNVNMWETLYMPPTEEFEITVEADKAYYLGLISARQTPGGAMNRKIEIRLMPDRELDSWQKLINKFPDSNCLAVVRRHIATQRFNKSRF